MSKLYVFAIGGTGSRVLRSLTMLLAGGVAPGCDIVPIIIDPDEAGGDVTKTVSLMELYMRIRRELNYADANTNRFFVTPLESAMPNFRMPINNGGGKKFEEYIKIKSMGKSEQALLRMLFSENNLGSDMVVGFKGNPNIGSVVLNQFNESKAFKDFATNFHQDDKIFIISSIFGGTGASGFPLLLKTLRTTKTGASSYLNNAPIGAISVLPYFGIKQDEKSAIDYTTFMDKTCAALEYYNRNISGNNSIDSIYYVADEIVNSYENREGGANQSNAAHFIELVAALAVIDFARTGRKNTVTQTKEFGIESDSMQLQMSNLAQKTQRTIFDPMTAMMLISRFCQEKLQSDIDGKQQPWAKALGIHASFTDGAFGSDVCDFAHKYGEWIGEMEKNSRSFAPFDLEAKDPLASVRGQKPNYGFISSKGFDKMTETLNKLSGEKEIVQKNGTGEYQNFMNLIYSATNKLINDTVKK